MKGVWIYPEDIGASGEWSNDWKTFCLKFGYAYDDIPKAILLTEIKVD